MVRKCSDAQMLRCAAEHTSQILWCMQYTVCVQRAIDSITDTAVRPVPSSYVQCLWFSCTVGTPFRGPGESHKTHLMSQHRRQHLVRLCISHQRNQMLFLGTFSARLLASSTSLRTPCSWSSSCRLEVYRSNTFSFEARSDRPVAFISYLSTDLFSEAAVVKEVCGRTHGQTLLWSQHYCCVCSDHAAAMSLNEHVAGHTSAHKVNKMSSRCVVREAMHSGSEVVVKQEWHNHTPIQISSVGEIR